MTVFALGFREGLQAALTVAVIASLARGTQHPARVAGAAVLASALSAMVVVGIRGIHLELSYTTLQGIRAVVAISAVVVATSTIRWLIGVANPTATGRPVVAAASLASIAAFAVVREAAELALLPGAGINSYWGPVTPSLAVGVLVASAVGLGAYVALRDSPKRLLLVASVALLVMAAGLAASAFRAIPRVLGWNVDPMFVADWAQESDSVVLALSKGVLGIHPRPNMLELIAYPAYLLVGGWMVYRAMGEGQRSGPTDRMGDLAPSGSWRS